MPLGVKLFFRVSAFRFFAFCSMPLEFKVRGLCR